MPDIAPPKNGYRAGWEGYLRHVVFGAPFVSTLRAGVRDVAMAEACRRSMAERKWTSVE